jgi:hypothetical protein
MVARDVGTSVRQPQRELSALLLIVSAAVASAVAMEIIPGLTALALANDRITADHSTSTSSDSVPKQLQSPDKRPSPPSLKIFQEAAEATSATASDIPPTATDPDDAMPKRQRDFGRGSAAALPQVSVNAVFDALHNFIQQERISNFNFLGQYSHCYMDQKELLVVTQAYLEDIADVRRVAGHHTTTTCNDCDWYTFDEPLRTDGFTRTVAIEFHGDVPTIESMAIVECSRGYTRTHNAATWIRDRFSPAADDMYEMRFSNRQYEEQRMWWNNTGKALRLLDLPAEMRESIYLQVVGPIVVPDVLMCPRRKMVLGVGMSIGDPARLGLNRDPDIQPPNMTIMRTNKQVRDEAMKVANRDTTKRFTTLRADVREGGVGPKTYPLNVFNCAWTLAPDQSFLRHIQLELTAAEYMGMVGIAPKRGQPLAAGTYGFSIDTLDRFNGLQTLDFRFISPKHKDAVCPWALARSPNHSCQKKWIDGFFIFGWDKLRALGASKKKLTFSLSGCVKDSTRVYWERVLNDRSMSANFSPEIKAREQCIRAQKTEDGPLICQCANLCYTDPSAKKLFDCKEHEVRMIVGLQEELDKVYWDFNG